MLNTATNLHVTQGGSIKIVDLPPGKAPVEIRSKWIGLELPITPADMHKAYMASLLTSPKCYLGIFIESRENDFLTNGAYFVSGAEALEILARASPETAKWWRKKAPNFQKPQSAFLFSAACCEPMEIEDTVWPPPPTRFGGKGQQ